MARIRYMIAIESIKYAILISLLLFCLTHNSIAGSKDSSINLSDDDRLAFINMIDLNKPELLLSKNAYKKNDIDAACEYYFKYFRNKEIASPLLTDWPNINKHPEHNTSEAERILQGIIWDGNSTYKVPGTGIAWHNAPMSGLTRFPNFGVMRSAIHHTENPNYVRYIVGHINDYCEAYPIDLFLGKSTKDGWVSYSKVAKPWYWNMISHRLNQLPETITLLRRFSQVSDDDLLVFLQRMYQEAEYLRQEIQYWVDRRHNCALMMIKSLAQTYEVLQDFKEVDTWQKQNVELTAEYIDNAIYPDGMCVELTTSYCGEISVGIQQLAYAFSAEKAFEASDERISQLVACQVGQSDPTGLLPSFGDLHASYLKEYLYQPAVKMLGLPVEESITSDEKKPITSNTVWPAPGQEQWAGYYTMRSDWSRDARYLAIDCGPWGTNHQHGDRLSFVITAYGEQFIIDPSGTKYASNAPDAFVSRQSAGFLHNTITVDGVDIFKSKGTLDKIETPLENIWEHGTDYTLFAGSYSFDPIKPVKWERRVLFVDGAYWLIQDVLTGSQDSVEVEQNFQFNNDIIVEQNGRRIAAIGPNGAQLILMPFEGNLQPTVYKGDKTPHHTYWPEGNSVNTINHGRGWTGQGGSNLLPAPAVTFTGTLKLPATLTLAVVPIQSEKQLTKLPKISSEKVGDETNWKLPTDKRILRFVSSTEKCSVINIEEPVLRLVSEPPSN